VNTPGVFPLALSSGGSYLFVADTYQPLPTCSTAEPCSGSVAVYPILTQAQAAALTPPQPADTLGTPIVNTNISASYWPLTLPSAPTHVIAPAAITTADAGAYVYVAAYDTTATPNAGYIFGFSVNGDGTLSALAGSPLRVGTHLSGIASAPGGANIYATDYVNGTVHAYTATSGVLTEVNGSPFATGNQPAAVIVDATGNYVFVANSLDSNLSVYSSANGILTALGTYPTGTQPVAIGIDPSSNQYVYTANFLGNNVSGFQLNATSGNLLNSQYSPSASNLNPTAVAAIPHGTPKK